MNTKFAASALVLASTLLGGTSFAQSHYQEADRHVSSGATSTLTREAVKADYVAAKNAGGLPPAVEGQDYKVRSANTSLTREAVKADYQASKRAGGLPQINNYS